MITETLHDYKYLVLETSLRSSSLEFFETGEEALTHFENRGDILGKAFQENQCQGFVVLAKVSAVWTVPGLGEARND